MTNNLPIAKPGETAVTTGISNLVNEWLFSLDCAQTTQNTYRRGLERFTTWLSSSWVGPVDATAVRTWREHLAAIGMKPATVSTWLAGVPSFYLPLGSGNRPDATQPGNGR